MKEISILIPSFDKANASSKDLYFVAGKLVSRFATINEIKAHKAEISAEFGNYKEILSRCKEIIKTSWNESKKAVLSELNYKSVLSAAWDIVKRDAKFSAICKHAEDNGIFANAEDFVKRFYPYINENGNPLVRQTYTDGWYVWTEYHERPLEKFTDSFALSALKATIRYYYDSIRNSSLSRKVRDNETSCDVPLKVRYYNEDDNTKDLNLETALEEIAKAKAEERVLTLREYNEALKK